MIDLGVPVCSFASLIHYRSGLAHFANAHPPRSGGFDKLNHRRSLGGPLRGCSIPLRICRIYQKNIFPNGKIFSHIRPFFIDFPVRESYTVDMRIISVESISEAVKNRRKQLGLTQSETAAMCNVGARFFSELENGKETLQMNKVLHCLEMLGINLYAVNREDDK